MKCYSCPAYSKKDGFTGCLALQHKIHSAYDGCNRSKNTIERELYDWMRTTDFGRMNRFNFWCVCKNPLDSHWISADELRENMNG